MIVSVPCQGESTTIDRFPFSACLFDATHDLSVNTSNTDDSRGSSLARLLLSCLKNGYILASYGSIWKPFDSPTKSSHEVLFPSRAFFSMEFFTPVGFNEASSTTQQSHEQFLMCLDHLLSPPCTVIFWCYSEIFETHPVSEKSIQNIYFLTINHYSGKYVYSLFPSASHTRLIYVARWIHLDTKGTLKGSHEYVFDLCIQVEPPNWDVG